MGFMDEARKLKKVCAATSNLEWFPMYFRVKYDSFLPKPEFGQPDTTRYLPEQNLAALLVEPILWKQTKDLAWDQNWSELKLTVTDRFHREVDSTLTRHINNQSGKKNLTKNVQSDIRKNFLPGRFENQ